MWEGVFFYATHNLAPTELSCEQYVSILVLILVWDRRTPGLVGMLDCSVLCTERGGELWDLCKLKRTGGVKVRARVVNDNIEDDELKL